MRNTKPSKVESKLENFAAVILAFWVGIDVHKKSYHVSIYGEGKILLKWTMSSDDEVLIEMLMPIIKQIKMVCYEAGPTGYGLYRKLTDTGFPAGVVAASKMLKSKSDESKTDSIDSGILAEHAAKNLLEFVTHPTLEQEDDRQLARAEEQTSRDRRRSMARIKSFLLMHGVKFERDDENWTKKYVEALRTLPLTNGLRVTLDSYLMAYDSSNAILKHLSQALKELDKKHGEDDKIIQSHPGVGTKTSRIFRYELFDANRFKSGDCVARFLGLAPGKHQSGERDKSRGVLKGGQGKLRSCLIQCAWTSVRHDPEMQKIYSRLLSNTGSSKKAIVGIARRITIHLWTMWSNKMYYQADYRKREKN